MIFLRVPVLCLLTSSGLAFQTLIRPPSFVHQRSAACCHATVAEDASMTGALEEQLLGSISSSSQEAKEWSDMFGLSDSEAAFYALFKGIRNSVPLGLKGQPFVLHQADIVKALDFSKDDNVFKGWFDIKDLEKAVNDDFLDADRGSTDNRKGWQVASVSEPRGNSFEDAKMLFSEVEAALEQGTVIFNSAGAHIPKLACANLAAVDATSLPCAVNIYVTAPGKRTSAPPHTDKQDVVVVQTSGKKHWRVYSPPDPSMKPMADMVGCGLLVVEVLAALLIGSFSHTLHYQRHISLLEANIRITFHCMLWNRNLVANSCWKRLWTRAMCCLFPPPFHTQRIQRMKMTKRVFT